MSLDQRYEEYEEHLLSLSPADRQKYVRQQTLDAIQGGQMALFDLYLKAKIDEVRKEIESDDPATIQAAPIRIALLREIQGFLKREKRAERMVEAIDGYTSVAQHRIIPESEVRNVYAG